MCHMISGSPYIAANLGMWEFHKWDLDQTYVIGYEFAKLYGLERKLRAYMEYHNGYSAEGQFCHLRTQYFSVRHPTDSNMDEELREENFITGRKSAIAQSFSLVEFSSFAICHDHPHRHPNLDTKNIRRNTEKQARSTRSPIETSAQFLSRKPPFLNDNVSTKEAYLPGLKYLENIQSKLQEADELVDAPDDVIFQYQTWNRLIDYPRRQGKFR